jgi:hypothetical protein
MKFDLSDRKWDFSFSLLDHPPQQLALFVNTSKTLSSRTLRWRCSVRLGKTSAFQFGVVDF